MIRFLFQGQTLFYPAQNPLADTFYLIPLKNIISIVACGYFKIVSMAVLHKSRDVTDVLTEIRFFFLKNRLQICLHLSFALLNKS